MMKYILTVLYLIFTTLGITLMKQGGDSLSIGIKNALSIKMGYVTLLGFICYIVSFILWQRLIVKFDLSYIVPITAGIIQIIILIVGKVLFKENINLISLLGVFIVIIGISLIVFGKK